jgi:hypothetical protein
MTALGLAVAIPAVLGYNALVRGNKGVLHKLNQCGTATGSIYRQGLGEFFLDDLWRQEAVWSVPAPHSMPPPAV